MKSLDECILESDNVDSPNRDIANHNLAVFYLEGKLVKKDISKALHYFEQAAKLQHAASAYKAGLLLEKIALTLTDPAQKNALERKAILYYKMAANLGSLESKQKLNKMGIPFIVKQERSARMPLSFAQQRLWFLEQFMPNSSLYTIPIALRLQGRLDVPVLNRAFKALLDRHEILRTQFINEAGAAAQEVLSPESCHFEVEQIDVSALPKEERERATLNYCEQTLMLPFDLQHWPLMRVLLIKLDRDDHVLCIYMHHIISDGWSMSILAKELSAFYNHYLYQEPITLNPLPIQYVDYALWQRQWLQGEILENEINYWQTQLADIPAALNFPFDKQRPDKLSYHGAKFELTINKSITTRLKILSEQEQASLFMTLSAALFVLLYRYTGQETLVLGSPIANRHFQEIEGLLGFFVNSLVLKASLHERISFTELLKQVKEYTLNAYSHQDLPFEQLVEHLQIPRVVNRHPVFQVLFAFQNNELMNYNLRDLTVKPFNVNYPVAKFDLAVVATENIEGELHLEFEYATDLFEANTIERLAGHFKELLIGISKQPQQMIIALPLLTNQEQIQIVSSQDQQRIAIPQLTISALFEAQVNKTPNNVAVIFENERLTYLELNQRANKLAHYLRATGVKTETLVAICIERNLDLLVGLLGILKAGGAYLPLIPDSPQERLDYMLIDADVSIIVTQSNLATQFNNYTGTLICIDGDWEKSVSAKSHINPEPINHQNHLAYAIYTSGSTGKPKGVLVNHHGVVNLLLDLMGRLEVTTEDKLLAMTTVGFDIAGLELYGPLIKGASVVIASQQQIKEGRALTQVLNREKITLLQATPSMWSLLLDSGWKGKTVKSLSGGEQLPDDLAVKLLNNSAQLWNLYGPTETSIWSTALQIQVKDRVNLGSALTNTSLYILDTYMQPVPVGVVGELYIGGIGLARGYLNRADLTAEKFVANPFDTQGDGSRLYRTGDLARFLNDGTIEYIGRIDNQVKIRGYRIELGEIETLIKQHAEILEALVVASENSGAEKRLVAYIIPRQSNAQSLGSLIDSLRQFLIKKLPEYMVPSGFMVLEQFPLNSNGKIDRRSLPVPDTYYRDDQEIYTAPQGELETQLAEIWSKLLGLKIGEIGREDNFFKLGGHSLLATRLCSIIQKEFAAEISLLTLFDHASLRELASQIEASQGKSNQTNLLAARKRPVMIPLSYAQERLWFIDQLLPNNALYTVPIALKLLGTLKVADLRRSFESLIERHEILRTRFVSEAGLAKQAILSLADCAFTLEQKEVTHLSGDEREQAVLHYGEAKLMEPFNLSEGSLIRAQLIKLSEAEHVLYIYLHHIISDGWSISIIARELSAFYNYYSHGEGNLPDPLEVQYADFTLWQREWLQGDLLEKQLSYWKEELAEVPESLDLPFDKKRPENLSYQGNTYKLVLDAEQSRSLKKLGEANRASLFMVLLSGLNILLYRYTHQETIVVGTPIANRHFREIEGLVGFFINTLALRTDVKGEMSFVELLNEVREMTLKGYAHQDLPFEKLIDHLQIARSVNRQPLFQVMLTLQNNDPMEYSMQGIEVQSFDLDYPIAKFDLAIVAAEDKNGELSLVFEYATDLFDVSTIERMSGHLKVILTEVVKNSNQAVAELALLTEQEKNDILSVCNQIPEKYLVKQSITQLFEQQVEKTPFNVAVKFGDDSLTYQQLNERANQVAHCLRNMGVKADTLVAISLPRSLDLVISLLAILKAGGAYVPLDANYPEERLHYMLEDSHSKIFITYHAEQERYSDYSGEFLFLDKINLKSFQVSNLNSATDPSQLAYVIYTSGSTGKPKGVMVEHRQVLRLFKATETSFDFSEQDIWTLFHSYSFDFAVWELWGALLYGGCLVIVPEHVAKDVELFHKLLIDQKVTVLNQTPSAFNALQEYSLQAKFENKLSLRWIIFGGEALNINRLLPWINRHGLQQPALVNMYGITETTVHVTFQRINSAEDKWLGKPLSDLSIYILDSHFNPVPIGVTGELFIKGDGLARGYLNRPELTAERFIVNPFVHNGNSRLYRTGDLAKLLPCGNLIYMGRKDTQVKVRGYRIEIGEIEQIIQNCNLVKAAIVLLINAENEKQLVAYVVFKDDESNHALTTQQMIRELKQYISEHLPVFMTPAHYVPISALPLTPNGKVDQKRLLELKDQRVILNEYEPPREGIESILSTIWSKVFGITKVGRHDNYFELGGDSIRSIQVVTLAKQAGLFFSVADIFKYPNLSLLAMQTNSMDSAPSASVIEPFSLLSETDHALLPNDILDAYPLTALQAGMLFHSRYSPEQAIYQDTFSYELKAKWNEEYFRTILNRLLDRHDVLRTAFILEKHNEPLQYVYAKVPLSLQVIDCRGLDKNEQKNSISEWFQTEKQQRFILDNAPLIRFSVHLCDEDHFYFGFSMHHAIVDGWSVASMVTELLKDYSTLLSHQPLNPISQFSIGFKNYVALERSLCQDEDQINFWKSYLLNASYLELKKNQTSLQHDRSTSANYKLKLDIKLQKALSLLSSQIRVPIKTLFLTAFCRFLSILSAQSDIVFGYTVNGRLEDSDGDKILGLFLNTIPFRVNLSHVSWHELINEIYRIEQDLLKFRRYPLAEIQTANKQELFEVAFNYTNFHIYNELDTSQVEILSDLVYEETNFGFGINIFGSIKHGYQIQLAYDGSLFSESQMSYYAEYYVRSLQQMTENIENYYDYQSVLSSEEWHKIINEWNPAHIHKLATKTFGELFEQQAALCQNSVAIVSSNQSISYQQLNAKANQLAQYLRKHYYKLTHKNLTAEVPIGICLERSLDMVIAILAIIKVGATYVPLDPDYPEGRLKFMIEDSGVKIIVTQSSISEQNIILQNIPEMIICLDKSANEISRESSENTKPAHSSGNLLYIIYTSGSTGRPKGVMVTHANLMNSLQARNHYYNMTLDSLLLLQSISVDTANLSVFWTLLQGGKVVIPNKEEVYDLFKISKLIAQNNVSHLLCTPSLYNELLESAALEQSSYLTSLRAVVLGGENLTTHLVEKHQRYLLNASLFNEFGVTEGSVWSCVATIFDATKKMASEVISVGKPALNSKLYILDKMMQPVPSGIVGELYIGSIGIARGYLNQPDLTAERFLPNPFITKNEISLGINTILYRTGDLACYSENGEIEYLGRIDNQIKIRGFRVELKEIESTLNQITYVKNAAVIAKEDQLGKNCLIAYIVLNESETHLENDILTEIKQLLSKQLPDYMIPNYFVPISKLPINVNGKIDISALPTPDKDSNSSVKYVSARNEIEQKLIEIWSVLLKIPVDNISIYDNFFNCGGDSIISIQLVTRARAKSIYLTVKQIFEHPVLCELASVAEVKTNVLENNQHSVSGRFHLTPIQHWFFEMQFSNLNHFNQAFLLISEKSLQLPLIEQALRILINHHDILRARYHVQDRQWQQIVESSHQLINTPICQSIDLTKVAEDNQAEIIALRSSQIQQSLDIEKGPLLQAALFNLGVDQPQRLLLVVHHLLIDGVSWRILIEDLAVVYNQLHERQEIKLPSRTHSYQIWGLALQQYAQTNALQQQLDFWLKTSASYKELPTDLNNDSKIIDSRSKLVIQLDKLMTSMLLQQAPRAYNTQINDILLTALTQTFCEWTQHKGLYLYLEGHGRETDVIAEDLDLSRTIGWFTSMFPIYLSLEIEQTVGGNLKNIKEQLRKIPDKGIGYGVLRYLTTVNSEMLEDTAHCETPLSTLRERSLPQVSFNYLGQIDNSMHTYNFHIAKESVGLSVASENQDHLLFNINSFIADGNLTIEWTYSSCHYQESTIQDLANQYIYFLTRLINHCCLSENVGYTPSDFPLVQLTQEQIDELFDKRQDIEDIYPLSPMQSGLLFHSLYSPNSDDYFLQLMISLSGHLDSKLLMQAWKSVIDHHTVLRSEFVSNDLDQPLQCIRKHINLAWQEYDWQKMNADEQQVALEKLTNEQRTQLFILDKAPLLRLQLIKTANEHHFLLFNKHHILTDGWSLPIILKDVFDAYQQLVTSPHKQPLLLKNYRYSDYIVWLKQQNQQNLINFWKDYLHGFVDPTYLAQKKSDVTVEQSEYQEELSIAEMSLIREFVGNYNLTLNTLLQATVGILISHYTRQKDVIFGVTVSGRSAGLSNQENMVGLFINTLPLRIKFNSSSTLLSLLQNIQHQMLSINQYSYGSLAQIQSCSELGAGNALFDTLFVFENYPDNGALSNKIAGIEVKITKAIEKVEYPLTIFISANQKLNFQINYEMASFSGDYIKDFCKRLKLLLLQIVKNPQQCFSELSLLTNVEKQTILKNWNATAYNDYPRKTIHQLFEEQVERTPNRTAIIFENTTITYLELNAKANQLANYLRHLNVTKESLVAVCLERNIDLIISLLAVLKSGGAYVPLDVNLPRNRLQSMLQDKISLLITYSHLNDKFSESKIDRVFLDSDWSKKSLHIDNLSPLCATDNLAYVIYTSGSTGQPKGVMIEHAGVVNCVYAIKNAVEVIQNDVFLAVTSLSFDVAAIDYFLPLSIGGSVCIASSEAQTNPAAMIDLLDKHNISIMQATPVTWQMLIQAGWNNDKPFKILTAGEALSSDLAIKLQPRGKIYNIYGPTEATIYATLAEIDNVKQIDIGKPLQNMQAYVLDDAMNLMPAGIIGELYLGGAGIARGYLDQPELTAEKFIANPFLNAESSTNSSHRLYRTGDLAKYSSNGNIEYMGRVDHQVKVRGFRIELEEIKSVLLQNPNVQEAIVVPQEDEVHQKQLIAYVVPEKRSLEDRVTGTWLNEIREFLARLLPDYMVPQYFMLVDDLPVNTNGKIDIRSLPKPDLSIVKVAYEAPDNEIEIILSSIWEKLLGVTNIGINDNFFHLGGDSIKTIQVVFNAHKKGIAITPKEIFDYPTISSLAKRIAKIEQVNSEQKTLEGECTLLPIQEWFFELNLKNINYFNQSQLIRVAIKLDKPKLAACIKELVKHHDAFRFRYYRKDDKWSQYYASEILPIVIHEVDINHSLQQSNDIEQFATEWQSELDIEKGELISVGIIRGHRDGYDRLFLAIHHLVIDGISWRILLSDLEDLYQGKSLSSKTSSYRDWHQALTQYADIAINDVSYWQNVEDLSRQFKLPVVVGESDCRQSRTISISFSKEDTHDLVHKSRPAYNTEINDLLLSAFTVCLKFWTQQNVILFNLEGHGREESLFPCEIDLSRSIGWFTTQYPIAIQLNEEDCADVSKLIISVKEQLRDIPDKGLSYGVLRYLSKYKLNYQPKISFNYLGDFGVSSNELKDEWEFSGEPAGRSVASENAPWLTLNVNGFIHDNQLKFEFSYNTFEMNAEAVSHIAQDFKKSLINIVKHCSTKTKTTSTISDYKLPILGRNSKPITILNGSAKHNLILIHPAHGGAESYLEFSKHFDKEIAVYLFEHFERYTKQNFRTIEEMAAFYIEQLLKENIKEPYHLAGWSLGGVIAYEMAQQLTKLNKQVTMLHLIDPIIWFGEFREGKVKELQQQLQENSLKYHSYSWIGSYRNIIYACQAYPGKCQIFLGNKANPADDYNDPLLSSLIHFNINNLDELNGFKNLIEHHQAYFLRASHGEIIFGESGQYIAQKISEEINNKNE
jgi:amino acid adenylation domain-containing protein/non-ribosomal peptide synthase protein (TIGR01720 family)